MALAVTEGTERLRGMARDEEQLLEWFHVMYAFMVQRAAEGHATTDDSKPSFKAAIGRLPCHSVSTMFDKWKVFASQWCQTLTSYRVTRDELWRYLHEGTAGDASEGLNAEGFAYRNAVLTLLHDFTVSHFLLYGTCSDWNETMAAFETAVRPHYCAPA
eukprot:TRINITY_DN7064_c0_g1_i1.p1 TRINITY_DN7064_c0_g1~~TRINITY_DN7064_c0_g1_i1.p1  ORF type:complete len:172 (-),score=48.98 TRINITY_DN7064_c0_g1_i1:355-831(-)